ncbi:hypothetical protein VC83_00942 [Pseudogymnoascus destructans]|uniref:Inhibitor I9 domain-containing protein n=2 Tax=Pseudogymnoascus destructans TaxID=655981 RepID=L8FPU4_PSED2|nr:uncharacterized protein VC83_00942 [Pseudogymnoascus destructans]ELR01711.1 hypothetical protein GMDG_00087 [Pseudogymnoascus destructans 20631-21]OAF62547.1 hypothetical protein VC83_00942 [Pseudogymnoascus destructans]
MKFTLLPLLSLLALASAAAQPQRQVIISYPDNTPYSVVEAAMDEIRAAGGMITHEYKIFKGFAAKAPAKALETVQAMGSEYVALIEEDAIVSVNSGSAQ